MKSFKHGRTIVLLLGAAGVLLSLPVLAARQGNAAQENRPRSAPEMEKLKFYLGEWDYTETYPKSPGFPNGGQNTGVYTSRLGPGGNSLINTFHSQGPVGDFDGLLIFTWDPKEKVYKAYAFGSDFPGAITETGAFEGDALVFRSEFSAQGTTMKLRNTTRVTEPGRIISDEFTALKDMPEKLLVHVEAKKR